jgi:hypothetical protein
LGVVVSEFDEYVQNISSLYSIVANPETKEVLAIPHRHKSRYFPEGQNREKKIIKKRLGQYFYRDGVLLTLTVRRSIGLFDAWALITKWTSRLLNKIRNWRRRMGFKKLHYIWCVEAHKDNYPHVHIYFPVLKWLAPKKMLDKWWPYGWTNVKRARDINLACYVTKYICKMSCNKVFMAMLWYFRLHLYGMSQKFKRVVRITTGLWVFLGVRRIASKEDAEAVRAQMLLLGYPGIEIIGGFLWAGEEGWLDGLMGLMA